MHPSLRVVTAAGIATTTLLLASCGAPSTAALPSPSGGATATGSGYYDELMATPLLPADTSTPSAAPTTPPRTSAPTATSTRAAAPGTTRRPAAEDDEETRPAAAGGERSRTASPTSPPPTTPPPSPRATRTSTPAPDTSVAGQVLAIVNERRAEAGCPPLRLDDKLNLASTRHSQDMADQDYFSHTSKDGRTPWDRARAAGYHHATGENIAAGYPTPASVMEGWMNSDGHRRNILACGSTEMGLGIARNGDGSPFWTQMFGAE